MSGALRVDITYALRLEPGDVYAGHVSPEAPSRPAQPFAAAHLLTDVTPGKVEGVTWMQLTASGGLSLTPVRGSQQVMVIRGLAEQEPDECEGAPDLLALACEDCGAEPGKPCAITCTADLGLDLPGDEY